MDRRTFLSALADGLLAAPLAAGAQQAGKVPQVGILSAGPLAPRMYRWEAFRQHLRELGYTEGQNIALVFRAPEREGVPLDEVAAELMRAKVNVIVVQSVLGAQAAKRVSGSIPIVMAGVSDPLRAGLIGSLARPGGNVTGVSMMSTELSGKRLELLREIAPSVSRVGILWNPTNPVSVVAFRDSEVAAKTLGVRLLSLEVRQPHEMDPALRAAIEGQAGALLLVDDRLFVGLRAQIADFALKHRLPTIYGSTAEAQPARRVWQVGLLDYGSPDAARLAWWRAFQEKLRELGYVEGQTVVFQPRWGTGQVSRLQGLATELVAANVVILVTAGHPATLAAKQATNSIPICLSSTGGSITGESDRG